MKKWLAFCVGLVVVLTTASLRFEDEKNVPLEEFKAFFKSVDGNRLHIHPTKYCKSVEEPKWDGKLLPDSATKKMGLYLGSDKLYALHMFETGEKKYPCFLIGSSQAKITVRLLMYDHEKKLFTFMMDAASYHHIESVMEQIRNTWVQDLDGDGNFDLATVDELMDHELPSEENISHTTRFKHIFSDNDLLYRQWGSGVSFETVVQK